MAWRGRAQRMVVPNARNSRLMKTRDIRPFRRSGGGGGGPNLSDWYILRNDGGDGEITDTPTTRQYLTTTPDDSGSWNRFPFDETVFVLVCNAPGVQEFFQVGKDYAVGVPDAIVQIDMDISFVESNDRTSIRILDGLGSQLTQTGDTNAPLANPQSLTWQVTMPTDPARAANITVRMNMFSGGTAAEAMYFRDPVITVGAAPLPLTMLVGDN